jgi:hypothetical protein
MDEEALTADLFIENLRTLSSPEQIGKNQHLKSGEGDEILGVRMGQVFALAKEFIAMPPGELDKMLRNPYHEVRAGALSIMDKQARSKKTPASRRKELYELYIRRHDRIDYWDLVDLAAPFVVGGYLYDKPRAILYQLARSESPWERRTAIVSTAYFIRQGDLADTFNIAEILVHDPHELVQKAVGGWIREAGKQDRQRLLSFLDGYAASMPRTMLRYAVELLDPEQRAYYMGLKKAL